MTHGCNLLRKLLDVVQILVSKFIDIFCFFHLFFDLEEHLCVWLAAQFKQKQNEKEYLLVMGRTSFAYFAIYNVIETYL